MCALQYVFGLTSAISLYFPSMEVRRSMCLRDREDPGSDLWEVSGYKPGVPRCSVEKETKHSGTLPSKHAVQHREVTSAAWQSSVDPPAYNTGKHKRRDW